MAGESPREFVRNKYGDEAKAWIRRVDNMTDAQVYAIYRREQEKLDKKAKEKR